MYNKSVVQVNLTKDSELKEISRGDSSTQVLNFSAANNRKVGDKEYTQYYECAIFGKRAESLQKFLVKGTGLILEGIVSADAYINKEGKAVAVNRLTVSDLSFVGGGKKQSEGGEQTAAATGDGFMDIPDGIDEALPFK